MPVIIPEGLPATEILASENVFVMHETRAKSQDIRPLRLGIVNLMPTKIVTETQLLRLIGNTSLQVEVDLIHMDSHVSKNTSLEHMKAFYKTFDEIKNNHYDGMIVTGAPVETMDFEEVNYWEELTPLLDFCKTNVFSTMFICWGAQAALYHYYGVPKVVLDQKIFGVYEHKILNRRPIVRGFDDVFFAPHSRHTTCLTEEIKKVDDLEILAESDDIGAYLMVSKDQRFIFVTGHSEYDPEGLKNEYWRDVNKGMDIEIPRNYFPNDDPNQTPVVRWRGHGNLLFANWLNYHVYQETPYNLDEI
ncbi:homoserine O-acetyltransferase MetA [Chakrabartyella piscis]|uniref:homoserine O-acetyltransferase MetA n=1 Tax=Chakrabartyella piscis TaxID=2918914 RepID=UPI002958AA75|nr:homoserine O-succinyltransferase [Chakrabartyella piscis]